MARRCVQTPECWCFSRQRGGEKKNGGHHLGKYADGAVGFVPAMFEEGLVISVNRYRAG